MTKFKYLTGIIRILKWSLLYPIDDQKSFLWKCGYYLWGFCFISSFVTVCIQCVIHLYITPFSLIKEAVIIMNTVIYLSLFINFLLLYSKQNSLVQLFKKINNNFVDGTDNIMDEITMEKYSKLSNKFAYYWTFYCTGVSLAPVILSLTMGNKDLPILIWLPYNAEKSPQYELTYIWQTFSLINLGAIYAVLDFIFPCIVILMGQQFKILGNNFKNGLFKALIETGIPHKVVVDFNEHFQRQNLKSLHDDYKEIFDVIDGKIFREINTNYWKKNIKHHQILLGLCDDINYIFGVFLMGKISAAIFNVLFMFFTLITTADQAMYLGLFSYVSAVYLEIFIYTYSGQILTENADLFGILYETPWYLCDLKFQKLFYIVQMRTKNMVYIRAGNYFSLIAPTFITFMKAVFSYTALLRELTEAGK